MSLEANLNACLEIDGAVAVALVDSSSGMALATAGTPRGLDLNVAAAGNTNVMKAKEKTMKDLGLKDKIEDVLITLTSQYHLIRPLTDASGKGLFIYPNGNKYEGDFFVSHSSDNISLRRGISRD